MFNKEDTAKYNALIIEVNKDLDQLVDTITDNDSKKVLDQIKDEDPAKQIMILLLGVETIYRDAMRKHMAETKSKPDYDPSKMYFKLRQAFTMSIASVTSECIVKNDLPLFMKEYTESIASLMIGDLVKDYGKSKS